MSFSAQIPGYNTYTHTYTFSQAHTLRHTHIQLSAYLRLRTCLARSILCCNAARLLSCDFKALVRPSLCRYAAGRAASWAYAAGAPLCVYMYCHVMYESCMHADIELLTGRCRHISIHTHKHTNTQTYNIHGHNTHHPGFCLYI